MTVPWASRPSNRRPTIMASAMSVICISSRQRRRASFAMALATGAIASCVCDWRAAWRRLCTSCMKAWKWTRRFGLHVRHGMEQVHQHGLAAADLAVDVEALAAAGGGFLKLARRPEGAGVLQRLGQRIELRHDGALRGIGLDGAAVRGGGRIQRGWRTLRPAIACRHPGEEPGSSFPRGLSPKLDPGLRRDDGKKGVHTGTRGPTASARSSSSRP